MRDWIEIRKGCAKGFLISLNITCIVLALSVLGFAVVDTSILQVYGKEQAAGSVIGNSLIVCVSGLVAAVAVIGCVGALKENVRVLYWYVVCLLCMVVLEMLVAILVSVMRYDLQYRVSEWLREDFFQNITDVNRIEHEKLWDDLQINYECCGLNGPDDYAAIGVPIGVSCCIKAYRARTKIAQNNMYRTCLQSASYTSEGCEDNILEMINADGEWLFGMAIIGFWFEAMGMLLAMWVSNLVKKTVMIYNHAVAKY